MNEGINKIEISYSDTREKLDVDVSYCENIDSSEIITVLCAAISSILSNEIDDIDEEKLFESIVNNVTMSIVNTPDKEEGFLNEYDWN